jgi:uncharacterized protein with von Willebrand factor type A (vWA) domain
MSGYCEMEAYPLERREMVTMPVDNGGPIIVCLDTSWSMEGVRERLAKAVVLEGGCL